MNERLREVRRQWIPASLRSNWSRRATNKLDSYWRRNRGPPVLNKWSVLLTLNILGMQPNEFKRSNLRASNNLSPALAPIDLRDVILGQVSP